MRHKAFVFSTPQVDTEHEHILGNFLRGSYISILDK